MSQERAIGTVNGLNLSVEPMFYVGSIVIWVGMSIASGMMLGLSTVMAAIIGFVALVLYWISEIVHQLGHAYAARQTGHPMVGIRLGKFGVFSTSLYPQDEGVLPAKVHVRRALGGPIGSLLFGLVMGVLALLLNSAGGVVQWLAFYMVILNVGLFAFGPLAPLGFTDGSTLLEWWGKQ